jgi:hypothetical protein
MITLAVLHEANTFMPQELNGYLLHIEKELTSSEKHPMWLGLELIKFAMLQLPESERPMLDQGCINALMSILVNPTGALKSQAESNLTKAQKVFNEALLLYSNWDNCNRLFRSVLFSDPTLVEMDSEQALADLTERVETIYSRIVGQVAWMIGQFDLLNETPAVIEIPVSETAEI